MSFSIKLFLFIAVALREVTLLISMRHEKRLKRDGAVEYGAKNSMALAVVHTAFYVAAAVEGWARQVRFDRYSQVGLVFYCFGAAALVIVMCLLGRLWTIKLLVAPNHILIDHALFRAVRHPNYYLNLPAELLGVALITHAFWTLLIGIPLYLIPLSIRVREEEKVMSECFPEYG